MPSGWVKSLQCKSRAFEDVVYYPNPKHVLNGSGCRKSTQSIKDVIETTTSMHKSRKPIPIPKPKTKPKPRPVSPSHRRQAKPEHVSGLSTRSVKLGRNPDPLLPTLAELSEGHPSRNVVEIIFHTSWSPKAFTGRVEMIFKVHSGSRMVTCFEEYREMVKVRAGSGSPTIDGDTWEENARCVADGNEMMRFHCLGPTAGDGNGATHDAWVFPGGKGKPVRTFSGSGGAHEDAGGGKGRRAMLVCRVVAGRVSKRVGFGFDLFGDGRVGFDSVSVDDSELIVFDPRAILPCFLIIYKL